MVSLSLIEKVTLSKDLTELREGTMQVPREGAFRQGALPVQSPITEPPWHAADQQGGQWDRSRDGSGGGWVRADEVLEVTEDHVMQALKAARG